MPAPIPLALAPHKLGKPIRIFRYLDASGAPIGAVARFDLPDGGKEVLPLTCWDDGGGARWRWQSWPEPRPLYGLDWLAQRLAAPVLLVEGEKAAEAAQNIFPDHIAVTSPGGAKAAAKADWSPLAGRTVTIWPDADLPGRGYATEAAKCIRQAGAAAVAIVSVPAEWSEAWDLADDLPAGISHAHLQAMLDRASPVAMDEGPLPLRRALPEPEPFPIDALGETLGQAAEAIHDLTQAPLAVCGQSVLAAATLAVQAHADVILPMGSKRPTSCFFITVAASGERKTSCDDLALRPVRDFLDGIRQQHSVDLTDWRKSVGSMEGRTRENPEDRQG